MLENYKTKRQGNSFKTVRDELFNTGDSGVDSINDRWKNTKHSILKTAKEV